MANPVDEYGDAEAEPNSVGSAVGRNCLPGSVWSMCGCSIPVQRFGSGGLPVGLQLLCPAGNEETVRPTAVAGRVCRRYRVYGAGSYAHSDAPAGAAAGYGD